MKTKLSILVLAFGYLPFSFGQTILDVNPKLFLNDSVNVIITTVDCTLSDGSSSTCYQITTTGTPSDHTMGPWCPDNILDDASAGGIWLEGGVVYDVDGAFIENMATFYNDNTWLMYDSNGDIYTTDTEADCTAAANPNVGSQYENFCVECLPSYVTGLSETFLLPVTPVEASTPIQFGQPGGPGGPTSGPSERGIAFNGVRYDAPAPTNAILSAYTLAPFDDAGGHINMAAGYHYHAATGLSKEYAQCDQHAEMIGYAIDGYGIFSQLNEDGLEPTDLDQCRGHYDDVRGYHYHVDAAGNNNFIDCLKGNYATASSAVVTVDNDNDGYNLDEDCDDNDPTINPGATEIYGNDIDENCDGILCADLGIDEQSEEFRFSIYPNPSSTGTVTIELKLPNNSDLTVKMLDLTGKVISQSIIQNGVTNVILDIESVQNGIYFINIASETGYYSERFVIAQ